MDQNLCQSCAMPMSGPEQMGREKDGAINSDYCCYCYKDGSFSNPDETLEKVNNYFLLRTTSKKRWFFF